MAENRKARRAKAAVAKKDEAPKTRQVLKISKLQYWDTEDGHEKTFVAGKGGVKSLSETADQLLVFFDDGIGGILKKNVGFWRIWTEMVEVPVPADNDEA